MVSYRGALEAAGAMVVEIEAGTPYAAQAVADPAALLATCSGLLLPGGPDIDPRIYGDAQTLPSVEVAADRDVLDLALAQAALSQGLPVFGVCRGIQVLNVAAGGTLWQDIPSQRPSRVQHREPAEGRDRTHLLHSVDLVTGCMLQQILGRVSLQVNSIHHQAVRALGSGLVGTAIAPDGIIEGLEAPRHPFACAVQWHPENLWQVHPIHARLFAAFTAAASRRA